MYNLFSDEEKINRLRLLRSFGIGGKRFMYLMQNYQNANAALDALPQLIKNNQLPKNIVLISEKEVRLEFERLSNYGAKLIFYDEDLYPKYLRLIDDFPSAITVFGNQAALQSRQIAIVGSRGASIMGKKLAEIFAAGFASHKFNVTSGLARGIDTAAHNAALSFSTIAVIGSGIDKIYPPENKNLYHQIAKNGAIITEMPFGSEPLAQNFPRRNRIISGMSMGTLVIEASLKSGSLITANFALEQAREVFAVPGSPLDERSRGGNKLIKEGAHLVENPMEVLQIIDNSILLDINEEANREVIFAKKQKLQTGNSSDKNQEKYQPSDLAKKIMQNLSAIPCQLDELIRETGAPASDIMASVLQMELNGKIARYPGNRIALIA